MSENIARQFGQVSLINTQLKKALASQEVYDNGPMGKMHTLLHLLALAAHKMERLISGVKPEFRKYVDPKAFAFVQFYASHPGVKR